MSETKTIDNVHVEIYGHEMLSELITRARKNNIPYDKEMKYEFHSHGHTYLVLKDGELTLLEDPLPKHNVEVSLNDLFELYLSKEEVKKELEVGKWYAFSWDDSPNNVRGVYLIDKIENDKVWFKYGVNIADNYWSNCDWYSKTHNWRLATPQEVEKALIEEAKKRYKVGGVIEKDARKITIGSEIEFVYNENFNFLNISYTRDGNRYLSTIFKDGQWATIIEQDKFAELKEAFKNGAVIEIKCNDGRWCDIGVPAWIPNHEYRIKPEEDLEIGDKVIGIRTDCAIVGEVTSISKKKVCVNNLVFLKDQVYKIDYDKFDDLKETLNQGMKSLTKNIAYD